MPTNITPLPGTRSPATSLGISSPSYQVSFTGASPSRSGNSIADGQSQRAGFGMHGRAFRFAMSGMTQLQGPERQVHVMAGHVAQRALAEVPPAPPIGRVVDAGPERTFGCGAQPQIPAQVGRWLLAAFGTLAAAPAFADPDMDFGHVTRSRRIE